MQFLSWMFFCLSPFALFCSESGNGLILCPTFIVLGFVFKWIGNNVGGAPKIKLDPKEFWEWHYSNRMMGYFLKEGNVSDELTAIRDEEARDWATTICGYHNAWVPPKDVQEQIARSHGAVTKIMVKEKTLKRNKIQIGKYYLMRELELKYEHGNWRAKNEIGCDMRKIKLSNRGGADDWYVKQEYGKTVNEMWKTLSAEEKEQAEKWVKEYEEKLLKSIKDYEERIEYKVKSVEMDF